MSAIAHLFREALGALVIAGDERGVRRALTRTHGYGEPEATATAWRLLDLSADELWPYLERMFADRV